MMGFCNRSAKEYVEAITYHRDSSEEFILSAQELLRNNPHEIITSISELGTKIKKRANEVFREIHFISAYMRLKPYPEMLLVGECNTEHNTGHSIALSLARKFDLFIILLFTQNEYFIASECYDINFISKINSKKREEIIQQIRFYAETIVDVRLNQDLLLNEGEILWEKYYETQFLEQRLNPKMFHKFIPKYALKKANMKLEKDFYEKIMEKSRKNTTLDSFL